MTAIVEIITGRVEKTLRVSNDALRFKPAAGSELANKVEQMRAQRPEGQRRENQPGADKKMAKGRRGLLWIQNDDGINPVPVTLGISDDQYTQVFGQKLTAGDVAITRIRANRG